VQHGKIAAGSSTIADFDDLPTALERVARRDAMGKVVVVP
jgi:hypothetical protein